MELGEDDVGGFCPDEGLGVSVVLCNPAIEGRLKVDQAMEDAAAYSLAGQLREHVLDGVEPRCPGGCEVKGPVGMARQPGQDLRVLVGGIVIQDDVDLFLG